MSVFRRQHLPATISLKRLGQSHPIFIYSIHNAGMACYLKQLLEILVAMEYFLLKNASDQAIFLKLAETKTGINSQTNG